MFNRRKTFIVLYYLFVFVCGMVVLELCSRAIWNYKYADWLQTSVNPFGYIDRGLLLEKYRPGYHYTIRELLSDLQASGKTIGYLQTKQYVDKYKLALDSLAFGINQFGLKGPDISMKPQKGITRILTIGDSCTFGPYLDNLSYPRQLEKLLNKWHPGKYEVVNAGHLGYNLDQVLNQLDEWLLLEPDIITIYIGWNRTIQRADPRKCDEFYEKSSFYRIYYHAVVNRTDSKGVENLFGGHFDMKDPIIQNLREKKFTVDIKKLNEIIQKIRNKSVKSRIILLTLASMYDTETEPSRDEIRAGYTVAFTKNLAAWAVLSKIYNSKLRELAIKENLILCDLETLARSNFRPRYDFFTDTVHPSPLGYSKIAEYLGKSIKIELSNHDPTKLERIK